MRILMLAAAASILTTTVVACGSGGTTVRTVTVGRKARAISATGDQRVYGRITSLARRGNHYELRFDPAWLTSGVTANVAQAADQGTSCRPSECPAVANDNYVVDESRRSLTYLVPAGVHGTVLVKSAANGGPFPATRITVAQLAELVRGESSLKLFEPLSSGMWILVHVDTVRTFAQQYRP
jgi:hypothetical protein